MKAKEINKTADLLKILAQENYEISGVKETTGNFIAAPLYTYRGIEFYISDADLRSITKGTQRTPPTVRVKYEGCYFTLLYEP